MWLFIVDIKNGKLNGAVVRLQNLTETPNYAKISYKNRTYAEQAR